MSSFTSNFIASVQGFDHHVKNDHSMWDYIHLSIYLDQIDISDHNAIESFVYNMVRERVIIVIDQILPISSMAK